MFGFLSRNRATKVRRTIKQRHLDDVEADIIAKQDYLMHVNSEIAKAERKRADIYRSTLDDIVELQEQGYEDYLPIKQKQVSGNLEDFAGEFIEMFVPKQFARHAKAYLKNRPELLAKVDTFLTTKGIGFIDKVTQETENPNTKIIER